MDTDLTAMRSPEYNFPDKRGVFYMVANDTFNYPFNKNGWKSQCREGNQLSSSYEGEIKEVRKVFGLTAKDLPLKKLTPPTEQGEDDSNTYEKFVTELRTKKSHEFVTELGTKKCDERPGFLMLFLMSHGLEDGTFLLHKQNRGKECCKSEAKHLYAGSCYARRITDLVKDVQTGSRFPDVPKIFIIQVFKGDVVPPKLTQSDSKLDSISDDKDMYRPRGSDTLVLYSYMQTHNVWLSQGFPLLPSLLCSHVKRKPKTEDDEIEANKLDELHSMWPMLYLFTENLQGGWITKVCSDIQTKMAEYNNKLPDHIKKLCRPVHLSTTLRKYLSVIKLLESCKQG